MDVFPRTADRRAHLVPAELDAEAPLGLYGYRSDPATEAYPLALVSPATDQTISTTLGELRREIAVMEMHPADALARGISDGDRVAAHNLSGRVSCIARVAPTLRPGVVSLPKGLWSHNTFGGSTANAVAPDTLADLGGGACFNDARVEVERLPAQ